MLSKMYVFNAKTSLSEMHFFLLEGNAEENCRFHIVKMYTHWEGKLYCRVSEYDLV